MSKILYILKIAFVTAFVSLLYFVIDYFLSIVLSNFNLDLLKNTKYQFNVVVQDKKIDVYIKNILYLC